MVQLTSTSISAPTGTCHSNAFYKQMTGPDVYTSKLK